MPPSTPRSPMSCRLNAPGKQALYKHNCRMAALFRSRGSEAVIWGKIPRTAAAAAFHPDGSMLVASSSTGMIRLWRLPELGAEDERTGPWGSVAAGAFSPDGLRNSPTMFGQQFADRLRVVSQ